MPARQGLRVSGQLGTLLVVWPYLDRINTPGNLTLVISWLGSAVPAGIALMSAEAASSNGASRAGSPARGEVREPARPASAIRAVDLPQATATATRRLQPPPG
jgi:hypothetical protein